MVKKITLCFIMLLSIISCDNKTKSQTNTSIKKTAPYEGEITKIVRGRDGLTADLIDVKSQKLIKASIASIYLDQESKPKSHQLKTGNTVRLTGKEKILPKGLISLRVNKIEIISTK